MAWNEQQAKRRILLRKDQFKAWKKARETNDIDDIERDGISNVKDESREALLDLLEMLDKEEIADWIIALVLKRKGLYF